MRSRNLQISDPDGDYVDPETGEHWRPLDIRADLDRIARQQPFIRKLAGLAISRAWATRSSRCRWPTTCSGTSTPTRALSRDDVNALVRAFRPST